MGDASDNRESGTNESYRHSDNDEIKRTTYKYGAEPWKDPHVLRTLYHERGHSQADIGERFGISQEIVSYWMDKLDVESDPPMHERNPSISRSVREDGRTQYKVPVGDGDREYVYESQIVALADLSPHEVFADDTHIHHEMGSQVKLNIPANLDVLGNAEHVRRHAGGTACCHPEAVLGELFEAYEGEPDPEDLENPFAAEKRGKRDRMMHLRKWRGHRVAGD